MSTLDSHVAGAWKQGNGAPQILVNPSTEEPIAEASADGLDLPAALRFARREGGRALRSMTFAERAEMLGAIAKAIHTHRDELLDMGMKNGGNTRSDAKFDVDGASGTLAHYAELGRALGDRRVLLDGDAVQLGLSPRLAGCHAWLPRHGVAVHINAFNFPAWGLGEKAACALLMGMPVVCKPATSSALVAHRIGQLLVEHVPAGAFSLVVGSAHVLPELLTQQDVIAFTGSSDTAGKLRALPAVASAAVRLNVEADSLNAAVLGPDVEHGSETYDMFVRDVAREMTQKAGQKCTAIRRVFVPASLREQVRDDLCERLRDVVVGDPFAEGVRMGPLATAGQQGDVRRGIGRLKEQARLVLGDAGERGGKGYFVAPTLLDAEDSAAVSAAHELEVFGPVATVLGVPPEADAICRQVARGEGGLVCSIYSDDRLFLQAMVLGAGPYHGRLVLGSRKIAGKAISPGTVLPQLVHGGPGRAGGGEELGGLRGLALYAQRTALQGDRSILEALG